MSTRPTARRSGLAGRSPAAPPEIVPAPEVLAAATQPVAPAPVVPAAPVVQEKAAPPKKDKEKLNFYQNEEDKNRSRAAFRNTQAIEGLDSMSDFIAAAIMEKTLRLEAEYNDGKPWPHSGGLKAGRPMRF